MNKINTRDVGKEDILIINNELFFVYGGDRRDHYSYYISKNDEEIDVTSIFLSDVERIIRHTCFIDIRNNQRRIYEGDTYLIIAKDSDNEEMKAKVVVDTNNYPYYFFRTETNITYEMHDCEWSTLISSEADQLISTYRKEKTL